MKPCLCIELTQCNEHYSKHHAWLWPYQWVAHAVDHRKCDLPRCSTPFQNVTLRLLSLQTWNKLGSVLWGKCELCACNNGRYLKPKDTIYSWWHPIGFKTQFDMFWHKGGRRHEHIAGCSEIGTLCWFFILSLQSPFGSISTFFMVIKWLNFLSFDSLVYCNILYVTGCSKTCLWLLKHKKWEIRGLFSEIFHYVYLHFLFLNI